MAKCLFDRLEAAGRLPTPQAVVLRLLDLARQETVSVREIADTLANDAVLAAKVIRFVNSPIAGVAREISSLQHAVAMVGINGVKMMALSFAILGSKRASVCKGFDLRQFGVQSVGSGVAAKVLSTAALTEPWEGAFLAGLLSQVGRSTLAIGVPEEYAKVLAAAQQIPRDLPPLEREALGATYPVIGAQLLRSWYLPDALCGAIEKFRDVGDQNDAPRLAKVLYVSEIAAGIVCPDAKGAPPDSLAFVEAAHRVLGIARERCASLIDEMASKTESMRELLELPKGKMRSPTDIEVELRERVAELTLAISIDNQRMAEQQDELVRRATTDALTGVGNRAAFDSRMALELRRSARSGAPFALLLMDVDAFKKFNDTYGHQAGDRVLQAVARTLEDNARDVDFVARYGGEEFALVAEGAAAVDVLNLAERLRRAVEKTAVRWGGQDLGVTISIGAVVFSDVRGGDDATRVIRAADEQLYEAKSAGRNRVEAAVDGVPAALVSRPV